MWRSPQMMSVRRPRTAGSPGRFGMNFKGMPSSFFDFSLDHFGSQHDVHEVEKGGKDPSATLKMRTDDEHKAISNLVKELKSTQDMTDYIINFLTHWLTAIAIWIQSQQLLTLTFLLPSLYSLSVSLVAARHMTHSENISTQPTAIVIPLMRLFIAAVGAALWGVFVKQTLANDLQPAQCLLPLMAVSDQLFEYLIGMESSWKSLLWSNGFNVASNICVFIAIIFMTSDWKSDGMELKDSVGNVMLVWSQILWLMSRFTTFVNEKKDDKPKGEGVSKDAKSEEDEEGESEFARSRMGDIFYTITTSVGTYSLEFDIHTRMMLPCIMLAMHCVLFLRNFYEAPCGLGCCTKDICCGSAFCSREHACAKFLKVCLGRPTEPVCIPWVIKVDLEENDCLPGPNWDSVPPLDPVTTKVAEKHNSETKKATTSSAVELTSFGTLLNRQGTL